MAPDANSHAIFGVFDVWATGTGKACGFLAYAVQWAIAGNTVVAGTYRSADAFLSEVIAPFISRMSSPCTRWCARPAPTAAR